MKATFELSKEQQEEMIKHMQHYFEKEHGEKMGNLKAMMFLDFITKEIAPTFYNKGVEDSHTYMLAKIEDIFEIQK
ncbi:DUF2164 domain-containing protein [Virgibacillus sp. W0430]|uniref:DUF2164 domain-containing protein n=1 Tax=Virgibacillus sp. W0430 TaxID=3391580 RepID=UPI003F457623